jgi:hypothetical protein
VLAWVSTVLEVALAIGLLVGFYLEYVAYAAAVLFGLFALGMTIYTGVKAPLDASVFGDLAAALLLGVVARMEKKAYPRG